MEGYIQIHRKMLEWEWYKNPNVSSVFIHCLLKANWKKKKWEGIIIERGEFITSYKSMSDELSGKYYKFSIKQVRLALNKLNRTGELTIKTTNRYTIIKVNNYDAYQIKDTQEGKQRANKGQTEGKQRATTNKVKKEKKDNNNIVSSNLVATKVATLKELIIKKIDKEKIINEYNSSDEKIKKELMDFYLYWSEKKPNGKKELWQMQKTFDVNRRFYKWLSNSDKWNKQENTKVNNLKFKTVRI